MRKQKQTVIDKIIKQWQQRLRTCDAATCVVRHACGGPCARNYCLDVGLVGGIWMRRRRHTVTTFSHWSQVKARNCSWVDLVLYVVARITTYQTQVL